MSRPLRLLIITALASAFLLIAVLGAVAMLVGTESGTRFLAGQARNLVPDTVQWSGIEGTILGSLRVRGLHVRTEGLDLSLEELDLSWRPWALLERQLRLDRLAGSGVQLVLTPTPEAPDTEPFNPADLTLPVAIDLAEVSFSDLMISPGGGEPLQVERVQLAARLEGQQLTLKSLEIRLPAGGVPQMAALGGSLTLGGSARWDERIVFALDYRLAAAGLQDVEASLPPQMTIAGNARGTQGGDQVLLQAVTLAVADTPMALSLAGEVAGLGTGEPRADLSLQWKGLNWPLQGEPAEISSAGGSATLKGSPSDYTLDIAAELSGAAIPPGQWALEGRGDQARLDIALLHGEVIGGELSVRGNVRWDPTLEWKLGLTGSGLEPGQVVPDLPGELAVSLQTDGKLDPEGMPQIELRLESLRGTLVDIPMQATAHARLRGESVDLVTARLESQGNTLAASGNLTADAMAINWQLDAPNPAALVAGAGGELSASGLVTGNPDKPRVQARISGDGLLLDSFAITSLEADVTAGPDTEAPLELVFRLGPVTDDGQALLESLQLEAAGTTGQHQLRFELVAPGAGLRARLDGGPNESLTAWRGRLGELTLDARGYGQWQLAGNPQLSLAADRASLGESCLQMITGPGRVCIVGDWTDGGESNVSGLIEALPLDLLLPEVSGDIAGRLGAQLAASGELRADGAITLGGGEVRVTDTQSLSHGGGRLELQIDAAGLLAQLRVAAPEQGDLQALVRLPALNTLPAADHQPLAGSMKAELPDLSGLAAWVPELGRSAGRLGADLQLGGSLAAPRVEGELALKDGAASLPLAGLEFGDIQLQAASDPARPGTLALSGRMTSGPGQLALTGQADLEAGAVDLALAGNRFQIYDTPDAQALMSPDLQIAWRDHTLKLRGQVTIPQADITPKIRLGPGAQGGTEPAQSVPGEVIVPSPDVVVVSDTLEITPADTVPAAPFRIDSRLRVQMGDKVRVQAMGLVSRIGGAVDFTNTPEQASLIPLARGRFSLEEGTFRAFGQDLEIETGQLIFADVPATEPEINLRAVRWIDNDPQVTAAGVQVTGPFAEPTLELFSRPQLETSEIQSYLLTGRSPRSKENVLGIGTYVSRRIYVGYGFNMLERTSEFNSLFNISPRYGLGSSVGEADNNINLTITYEH